MMVPFDCVVGANPNELTVIDNDQQKKYFGEENSVTISKETVIFAGSLIEKGEGTGIIVTVGENTSTVVT